MTRVWKNKAIKSTEVTLNTDLIFKNNENAQLIKSKLPYLFQVANLESSRDGKVGMEVGSVREKILIALLMHIYGRENVDPDISIQEPEKDVIVSGFPISIKTKSGKYLNGVKVIWTVDRQKILEFAENYEPKCDMLFAHIHWENYGGLYYFPKETQISVLKDIGVENYLKLPKQGTNPRGVEMSSTALSILTMHQDSIKIPVLWTTNEIDYDPYKRWLDYWEE